MVIDDNLLCSYDDDYATCCLIIAWVHYSVLVMSVHSVQSLLYENKRYIERNKRYHVTVVCFVSFCDQGQLNLVPSTSTFQSSSSM